MSNNQQDKEKEQTVNPKIKDTLSQLWSNNNMTIEERMNSSMKMLNDPQYTGRPLNKKEQQYILKQYAGLNNKEQKEWDDKSGLEKTGEGIGKTSSQGWGGTKNLIGNFAQDAHENKYKSALLDPKQSIAETIGNDIVHGITGEDSKLHEQSQEFEEKTKQRREGLQEAGEEIKEEGKELIREKQVEGMGKDGFWYEMGEVMGYALPSAAAAVTSYFNPAAAGAVGQAVIGTIGMSAAGSAMHEVEEYYRNQGQEAPDGVKYGVGLAAGASEMLLEQIPLKGIMKPIKNTKIGKKVLGKTVASELISNPKVANNIVTKFAKQNPKLFKRYAKGLGSQSYKEAGQEGVQQTIESVLHNTYMDEEDRRDLDQILRNGLEAAYKGGLMGGFVGTIGSGAVPVNDMKRWKKEGMTLAQTSDGEVYELMGQKDKEGNTFFARTRDGKNKEIKKENVVSSKHIDRKEFEQIAKKAKEGTAIAEKTERDLQKEKNKKEAEKLVNPDTDAITLFENEDGEVEYVLKGNPENNKSLPSNILFALNPKTGKTRQVAPSSVQNDKVEYHSVDEFAENVTLKQEASEQMQAQAKMAEQRQGQAQEQGGQLQKGKQVSYNGENYTVDEVSEDNVTLLKETSEESMPESIEVQKSEFQNIGEPIQEEQTGQEQQQSDQQQGQEQESQESQNPVLTIQRNKDTEKYEVAQQDDGSYRVNQTFTKRKEAEKVANELNEEYENSEFTVIDETPKDDPFAKNQLYIHVEPKTQQNEETNKETERESTGEEKEENTEDVQRSDEQVNAEQKESQKTGQTEQEIGQTEQEGRKETATQDRQETETNQSSEEGRKAERTNQSGTGEQEVRTGNAESGNVSQLDEGSVQEQTGTNAENTGDNSEIPGETFDNRQQDSVGKQISTEEVEGMIVDYLMTTKQEAFEQQPDMIDEVVDHFFNTNEYTEFYGTIPAVQNRKEDTQTYKTFLEAEKNVSKDRVIEQTKSRMGIAEQQNEQQYEETQESIQEETTDEGGQTQEEAQEGIEQEEAGSSKEGTDQERDSQGENENDRPVGENQIFTEEMAEKARQKLREKLNNTNAGADPETAYYAFVLGGYHVEKGARKFSDFVKAMVNDIGSGIKPHLKGAYASIKRQQGMESYVDEMDSDQYADNADIDEILNTEEKTDLQEKEGLTMDEIAEANNDLDSENQIPIENAIDYKEEQSDQPEGVVSNEEVKKEYKRIDLTQEIDSYDLPPVYESEIMARFGLNDKKPGQLESFQKEEADRIEKEIRKKLSKKYPELKQSDQPANEGRSVETEQKPSDKEATSEKTEEKPSEAQKKAGNYKKEKRNIRGLEIAIENPKGSERSGTDQQGNEWSVTINHDYGYFNRTKGKDGDQIDVFLSENPEEGNIYVVDQYNEDGSFDEHKVMMGFASKNEALKAYKSNYNKGADNAGAITEVTEQHFKEWLNTAQTYSKPKRKPFSNLKTIAKNSLLDQVEQYNKETSIQKRRKKYQDIVQQAAKLGYKVKDKKGKKHDNYRWDIGIFNDNGKKVYRDNEIKNTSEMTNFVPLNERSEKVQEIFSKLSQAHEVYPKIIEDLKLGGLKKSEVKGAIKDIQEGKNTYRAHELLAEFENAVANDYFSVYETGKGADAHYEPVSVDEVLESVEDVINKVNEENTLEEEYSDVLHIISEYEIETLEDLESLNQKGYFGQFPYTEYEYNRLKEYLNEKQNEERRNQKESKKTEGKEDSSKDAGKRESSEDSQRTPEQQKIAEQYDQRIREKEEELSKAKKKREKKVAELNDRNGLWGDTQEQGDLFAGDALFEFNKENYDIALKPYDQEIERIKQEIEQLKSDKEKAIQAAEQQGDLFNDQKQDKNVRNRSGNTQQDSGNADDGVQTNQNDDEPSSETDRRAGGESNEGIDQSGNEGFSNTGRGQGRAGGSQNVGGSPASTGKGGNQQLRTGEQRSNNNDGVSPDDRDTGSGSPTSNEGKPVFESEEVQGDSKDNQDLPETSSEEHGEKQQQEGKVDEQVKDERGNKESIAQSLPQLYPEQHTDVQKGEKRLYVQGGKGMLFANATGTGKTYTGLGLIKREKQFNPDGTILIVVPSQPKIKDWADVAENLDMELYQVPDTKSKPQEKGINIVTFKNFIDNNNMKDSEFDLVMYDESHKLMGDNKGQASQTTINHYQHTNKSYHWTLEKYKDNTGLWPKERELRAKINELEKYREKGDVRSYKEINKKIEEIKAQIGELNKQQEEVLPELEEKAKKAKDTKAVFLSATPFKSHFNLRYANKYLFDWGESENQNAYNVPDAEENFFVSNFGYRMRHNKLTQPDEASVDVSALERRFADALMEQGSMSARVLEVNKDYSREFPIVSDKESQILNEGIKNAIDGRKYEHLSKYARFRFIGKGHYPKRLFEVLKANYIAERIKKHRELGRKVAIYHGYNEAEIQHPFNFEGAYYQYVDMKNGKQVTKYIKDDKEALEEYEQFKKDNPQLFNLSYDLINPIDVLKKKLGEDNVMVYNGRISNKEKNEAKKKFNDDNSGKDILIVNQQAGKEGIDLHDKEGGKQRVMMNITMPSDPITALQVEGRIYRMGVQSNAIMEYPVLGLDLESALFGSEINRRVGTTENLAMGSIARDLRKSFKQGFEHAESYDPHTEQGTGGKERDARQAKMSEYEEAKALYHTNLKKTSKNKSQEGQDYFATPEPLGFKMIRDWAKVPEGGDVLEPSAGHGAIARFAPEKSKLTALEPMQGLFSKLKVNAGSGRLEQTNFENLDKVNSYDSVVMNPPFGKGGKTAIEHIQKAFNNHLRDRGRIVAIVPEGNAMQKRLDDFFNGENEKGKLKNPDAVKRAEITLPSVTFERAGTKVRTKVIVIDKVKNPDNYEIAPEQQTDLTHIESTKELFERIEELSSVPDKISQEDLKEDAKQNEDIEENQEAEQKEGAGENKGTGEKQENEEYSPLNPDSFVTIDDYHHTKHDKDMKIVKLSQNLARDDFFKSKKLAKNVGGYWSKYAKGFLFDNQEQASEFARQLNENFRPKFRIKKVKPFHSFAENPKNNTEFAGDALNLAVSKGEFTQAIQSIADQFNSDLNANIKVVRTEKELPERVRQQKKTQQIQGEISGVHDPRTGKTYIIADNIKNTDAAKRVALHEIVGHKGLRGVLGGQYNKVLEDIYNSMEQSDIDRISQMYNTEDKVTIADEYVAEQAEKDQKPNVVQKAVSKVRELLRNFFNLKYNQNDINNLLQKNREYLRKGANPVSTGQETTNSQFKAEKKEDTDDGSPKFVKSPKDYFVEGVQDLQVSVKKMQKEVKNKRGGKIPESANVYKKEILSYGKVREKQEQYEKNHEKPLNDVVEKISKKHGQSVESIGDYLIAKHSLENNEFFREKHVKEYIEKQQEKGKEPTEEEINGLREDLKKIDFTGFAENVKDQLPDDYSKQVISNFENNVDSELVNKLHKEVRKATDFVLQKWFDYDRINSDTLEELRNRFNFYVPLKGWDEAAEEKWDFSSDVADQMNTLMKRKGRKTKPANPLPQIHSMANAAIIEGERNAVRKAFARLISANKNIKDKDGNSIMDGIGSAHIIYAVDMGTRDKEGNTIRTEMIERPSEEYFGQKNENGEPLVKTRIDNTYKSKRTKYQAKEQEIEVYMNGKKYILYANDPNIARAIRGDIGTQLGALRDVFNNGLTSDKQIQKITGGLINHTPGFGEITRTMGQLYTSYNPNFIFANMTRDIPLAAVAHFVEGDIGQTRAFIKNMRKSTKALLKNKGSKEEKKYLQDEIQKWLDHGGETGWMHLKNPERYERKIRKKIKRLDKKQQYNPLRHLEEQGENVFKHLEQLANFSENIARFATFLTYKDMGYSNDEAAYQSKRVTVNFNKKGKWSNVLGANYVFFNAAVQGIKRYGELWGASPSKFGMIHGLLMSQGFMVSWLLDLFGGEDDEGVRLYDKINDYKKHNYMILPTFDGKTLDIPMPHILRYFHMVGGLSYDAMTGRKSAEEVIGKGIGGLSKAFIPVDASGFVSEEGDFSWRPLIPTYAIPWYDIAVNKNFAEYSIYKEPFTLAEAERKADSQMYFDHINKLYPKITDALFKLGGGDPETGYNYYYDEAGNRKEVPDILDVNPAWIEHLVTSYFGGAGKLVNQIMATSINTVEAGKDLMDKDKNFGEALSNIDLQQVPILYRFLGKGYADPIKDNYHSAVDYYRDYDRKLNEWKRQNNYEEFFRLMDAEKYYKSEMLKEYTQIINELDEYGSEEQKRKYIRKASELAKEDDPREYEPLNIKKENNNE